MQVKVGDTVEAVVAGQVTGGKIISIEKDKKDVQEVTVFRTLVGRHIIFDLDIGRFAYSNQVKTVNGKKIP